MELESKKLSISVQEALEHANLEMLPEKIKSDDLFRWVYKFTSPLDTSNQVDDLGWSRYEEDLVRVNIKKMMKNSSAVCLNYYFTSIFLIGRQMKVSHQQIENIQQAFSESNLENTFLKNIEIIMDNYQIKSEYELERIKREFIKDLQRVLEDTLVLQRFNYETAYELLNAWKNEVDRYKYMLENIHSELNDSYSFERESFSIKESILFSLIEFTTYEFVQLPLHRMLYRNGYRSQVSYDDIFAENLYLFTNILHYFFPPSKSIEYKTINESLYKKYFFKLTAGLKKLGDIKKSKGKFS
ncbi:hypothetical protein [Priestia aryabhattai]|uniref:hypothetical protein n=1 Tax=Priestia aryabhattai TaxID=412384 RepID=UPI001C8D76DD|nr:hypothetical protein [Priestia aryabhattai]MBY0062364.1 hypothetical protein [Priestia aryabhattai]